MWLFKVGWTKYSFGIDDIDYFSWLDDFHKFSVLNGIDDVSGLGCLTKFSVDGRDNFPELEGSDDSSIPNIMDCFPGMHGLALLDSLSDSLIAVDDVVVSAANPSKLNLKI